MTCRGLLFSNDQTGCPLVKPWQMLVCLFVFLCWWMLVISTTYLSPFNLSLNHLPSATSKVRRSTRLGTKQLRLTEQHITATFISPITPQQNPSIRIPAGLNTGINPAFIRKASCNSCVNGGRTRQIVRRPPGFCNERLDSAAWQRKWFHLYNRIYLKLQYIMLKRNVPNFQASHCNAKLLQLSDCSMRPF